MATTITWKHTGYKHETAGNECVSNVEWTCSGVDGDATGSYNSTTVLDRPDVLVTGRFNLLPVFLFI